LCDGRVVRWEAEDDRTLKRMERQRGLAAGRDGRRRESKAEEDGTPTRDGRRRRPYAEEDRTPKWTGRRRKWNAEEDGTPKRMERQKRWNAKEDGPPNQMDRRKDITIRPRVDGPAEHIFELRCRGTSSFVKTSKKTAAEKTGGRQSNSIDVPRPSEQPRLVVRLRQPRWPLVQLGAPSASHPAKTRDGFLSS
jgi:hypothetical protein